MTSARGGAGESRRGRGAVTSGVPAELWLWLWRRPGSSGSGSPEQGERAAVAAAQGRAAPGASRPSLALGSSALLRPLLLTVLAGSRQRAPGQGGAVGEAGGRRAGGRGLWAAGRRGRKRAHGRRRAGGVCLLQLALGGGAVQTVGRRLRRCFRRPVTQSPGRAAPRSLAPADRWASRQEALGLPARPGRPRQRPVRGSPRRPGREGGRRGRRSRSSRAAPPGKSFTGLLKAFCLFSIWSYIFFLFFLPSSENLYLPSFRAGNYPIEF